MRRLIDFWGILSIVVVLGGALAALLRELNRRRRLVLRDKQTFLSEIQRELEQNPAIYRAVALLKAAEVDQQLQLLLAPESKLLSKVEQELKKDLDTLFMTLNRIAQAVSITKILSREETEVFSWYFRLIQHHPILGQYFYDSGFLDLWDFAQSLACKDEVEI
jgi:hypothetical protein